MQRFVKRFCAAHRGDAGAFPGSEDQIDCQRGGDKVQPEPAENLVHTAESFEGACQRRPESAADHPCYDRKQENQRWSQARVLQLTQRPRGSDRAERDLPLHADIPQACGEGDQQARTDQQERNPRNQHVGEFFKGAERAGKDVLICLQGRRPRRHQDQCRKEQSQDQGSNLKSNIHPTGVSCHCGSHEAQPFPPMSSPNCCTVVVEAFNGCETFPLKNTSTRSLYCKISSRSEEMKRIAVLFLQRSFSFPQM